MHDVAFIAPMAHLKNCPMTAATLADASYECTTRDVLVRVQPHYRAEQSNPAEHYYFWSYRVEIVNGSGEPVQLRARHWQITDGQGRIHDVRGTGVVGEQPLLMPGQRFEYTSGVPLPTPTGFMTGSYQMQTPSGERFEVGIPVFPLDQPEAPRRLH